MRVEISGFIKLFLQALEFLGIVFKIPVCAKSINGDSVHGWAVVVEP
jgi:hypothetical protein